MNSFFFIYWASNWFRFPVSFKIPSHVSCDATFDRPHQLCSGKKFIFHHQKLRLTWLNLFGHWIECSLAIYRSEATDVWTNLWIIIFRRWRFQNCWEKKWKKGSSESRHHKLTFLPQPLNKIVNAYPSASNDKTSQLALSTPSYASSQNLRDLPHSFYCLRARMSCLSATAAWMGSPAVAVFPQTFWKVNEKVILVYNSIRVILI